MLNNLPELFYEGKPALPPQEKDLQRLYDIITESRSTTVLEFGCGYSTFVIAEALKANKKWFESLPEKPEIRNPNLWECLSVETNDSWIRTCRAEASNISKFALSPCRLDTFSGRTCHYYENISQIIPDFIYLDGPDPLQVTKYKINMPMSGDLLFLEPILIPGTKVLIDGRTNNARFLERNLQRNWKIEWNQAEDYTLMELDEPSLGPVIATGADILRWIENN